MVCILDMNFDFVFERWLVKNKTLFDFSAESSFFAFVKPGDHDVLPR